MKQSHQIMLASMAAFGVVACLLSWFQLHDARSSARDAATNLVVLQAYEKQVLSLRSLASNALMLGEQPVESSGTWIKYGSIAQIAETQFAEITRLPIAQIEGTTYSRDDVMIRLSGVTAEQVVRFGIECSNASGGYSLLSVELTEARQPGEGRQEVWNARLVLTRILYTATNQT